MMSDYKVFLETVCVILSVRWICYCKGPFNLCPQWVEKS